MWRSARTPVADAAPPSASPHPVGIAASPSSSPRPGNLSRVADADDVRRIALGLPDVAEIPSDGFDFRVNNRGFIWSYPEGSGRGRRIRTDIAVLFVGDEAEKQALLRGEPELFFTTPSYEPFALVMVRLDRVGTERLRELIGDAWAMRRDGSP